MDLQYNQHLFVEPVHMVFFCLNRMEKGVDPKMMKAFSEFMKSWTEKSSQSGAADDACST